MRVSLNLLTFSDMFNLLIIVYLVLGIGIGTIGSAISMKNIWRYNLFMKRKMLCIILILIITTLFCGVSFASREGELKEGIGQKENEIEQIKKKKMKLYRKYKI